jgi:NAD(P)-dependent dehydrogenase (short-subunit alcohol dehydrogenase family)
MGIHPVPSRACPEPPPANVSSATPPGVHALAARVAVVTGGSSGIGRAVAHALVEGGVHVALVGQSPERLQTATDALRASARATAEVLPLLLNVRSEVDMRRMADETMERFGRVDLLVAAAGVTRDPKASHLLPYPVAQTPTAEWDAVVETNLRGTFLSNRAVLPAMMQQRSGTIINVGSSEGGYRGQPFAAAYCASKFGVRGLSQALAEEVACYGIRVAVISPDAIDTPMLDRSTVANRLGDPLPPRRVADLVMIMWTLPSDVSLVEPVLTPARRPVSDSARRRGDERG